MLAPLLLACLVPFQDAALPALTPDEARALATISEGRVRTTVSFLSCDELEGRDTPSRGLRVASAYVAARFRGAGLEGLGKDGSFFLQATSDVVPAEGVVLKNAEGSDVARDGLVWAGHEALRYKGKAPFVGTGLGRDGDPDYPEDLAGPVIVDATTIKRGRMPADMQAIFALVSQARRAKRNGATALLVRAKRGSVLAKLAADQRGKAATSPLVSRIALPVLVLPLAAKLDSGIELVIPALGRGPSENRNVCGVLRGSDPQLRDEALLITAHLDHIGLRSRGKDRINNGADDDASGCTGVMGLADAFCALKTRPKRSVIFMTFWGEEKGLVGSRHFAAHPAWPLDKIVANVNIEMIGRPEQGARNKAWMTGWTQSDLGELVARGAKRAGVTVFRHRRFSPMLYRASDNYSFVAKGVIAHSFSAGSLHADYHQPGDEWQKLDLPHMTKIIQGLFAGCLPIAEAVLTPKKSK